MKKSEIKVDGEYLTRINGRLCLVKVTGERKEPGTTWRKAQTLFDWVRVNPPHGALKLKGADTAAALRPAPGTVLGTIDLPPVGEGLTAADRGKR